MDCYFVAVVGLVYSIDLDGDTIQDAIVVEQLMERSQTRCNPLLPCSSPLVWQRLTEKNCTKITKSAPADWGSGKYFPVLKLRQRNGGSGPRKETVGYGLTTHTVKTACYRNVNKEH
ncbi:hypothetical protein ElyMa_004504800 [Elysia marginata]|uniref:Uncharacterized protein n=1 Tax=Elysia marginata TaxID=1093978 RepID=A0AAV4HLG9_9GAST|nr:hypothetical protein ElyMa_004504800 [Elysia marginata]